MRLVSTRNPRQRASFMEAVQACIPTGGGLYLPDPLPCFRDVSTLLEMGFLDRSTEILHRMLGDEFSRSEVEAMVREAFDLPIRLHPIHDRMFSLELFHGPSLAFQDFGTRFLAAVLSRLPDQDPPEPRTLLVATLGNTGAAAACAFRQRKNIHVVVLHPAEGIPDLHLRQIACPEANVRNYAVDGSFRTCQDLAAQALEDPDLQARIGLTSANSLNIARLVAQVPLFFEAVAQVRAHSLRDLPVISIPCGNGGLLASGLLAAGMGLPVRAFVAATHADRPLLRALETGTLEPTDPAPTLSHSLDCGYPSNWERIALLRRERPGILRWGSLDDPALRKTMWDMRAAGCVPEPHAAVAHGVLQERMGLTETGILLATVHPIKSKDYLQERMNLALDMPPALDGIEGRSLQIRHLSPDYESLKNELLNKMQKHP